MAKFDQTISIRQSCARVWEQVQRVTGETVMSETETLLVVRRGMTHFVYYLASDFSWQMPATRLRLVITDAPDVVAQLTAAINRTAALNGLTGDSTAAECQAALAHLDDIRTAALAAPADREFEQKRKIEPIPTGGPFSPGAIRIIVIVFAIAGTILITPGMLTFLTTLFPALAGGILFAMNWRRLGKPKHFMLTLVLTLAGVPLYLVFLYSLDPGSFFETRTQFLFILLPAMALAGWQRSAYEEWVYRYGSPSFRWKDAGLCLGVGVVSLLLVSPVSSAVIMLLAQIQPTIWQLQPMQTYTGGGITLNYPGGWNNADPVPAGSGCEQNGMECLLVVRPDGGGMALVVIRLTDPSVVALSLETVNWQLMSARQKQLKNIEEVSQHKQVIDNHTAIVHRFVNSSNGTRSVVRWLLARDEAAYILIQIYCSPDFESTADDIIDSLHFTGALPEATSTPKR